MFLAIGALHSLTAAGDRLELTQPKVCHGLRRLRVIFDDPPVVRTPSGMVPPTPRIGCTRRLRRCCRSSMRRLSNSPSSIPRPLDACLAFRCRKSEFYFVPPLAALLERQAHGIRIECVQCSGGISQQCHAHRRNRSGPRLRAGP
ncbi:LysR family transcriptional regulator [Burkholderia pseudomultivorans]|uniref:helix-turn-helix domain-containing protein n=1 Tax=Burkholderia pseudomultivorans TaxID=1207504 RepID=UPI003857835F